MVRQFRLINELNEVYDLMDIKHYLNNPTGLGNAPVQRYETYNGHVVITSDTTAPMVVSGRMIFRVGDNDPYERYYELMDYLAKSQKVYLEYEPPGLFLVRAEISKNINIDKSEINGTNMMCPISFLRLENWNDNEEEIIPLVFESEEGKSYEYGYEYAYEETLTSIAEIENNSFEPIPLKIYFEAPYINPMIEVVSISSGQVISKWQWLGSVFDESILISNGMGNHMEQSTTLNNSNVYQQLNGDVGFSSYIYIPRGKYNLNISSDGSTLGNMTIVKKGGWNSL